MLKIIFANNLLYGPIPKILIKLNKTYGELKKTEIPVFLGIFRS